MSISVPRQTPQLLALDLNMDFHFNATGSEFHLAYLRLSRNPDHIFSLSWAERLPNGPSPSLPPSTLPVLGAAALTPYPLTAYRFPRSPPGSLPWERHTASLEGGSLQGLWYHDLLQILFHDPEVKYLSAIAHCL